MKLKQVVPAQQTSSRAPLQGATTF